MITTGVIKATHDLKFDGVYIDISIKDFNKLGFDLGDGVDMCFSNGLVLENIPYYDGYYPSKSNFVLCGYFSYPSPSLSFQGSGAWQKCELHDNSTVEVRLNTKAAYKNIQDTFRQSHPTNRDYYVSDEAFSNFRVLKAKNLKDNFVFRGGSPICNDFGFMITVNDLISKYDIKQIINLSETKDQLDEMMINCKDYYVNNIYNNNFIYPLDLSAFPREQLYAQKLVKGLKEITKNDGPIYIHCVEGKDRTGFLCILILALTGATIEDFELDYMKTYENFYYVSKEKTPEKYQLIKDHYFIGRLMNELCNTSGKTSFEQYNFYEEAIKYLKFGGMNENEINCLINYLHK